MGQARKAIQVLSFGAGVQSSALLHLAIRREYPELVPALDYVVFADTQWEPLEVYKHLESSVDLCKAHSIEFRHVSYGDIRAGIAEAADRQANGEKGGMSASYQPPLFTRQRGDDDTLKPGMMRRFCTKTYKVDPVFKAITKIRKEYKKSHKMAELPRVDLWLGISLDEIQRMKSQDKKRKWMTYRHPLAWDLRWTRKQCIDWFISIGQPIPPRSACVGCPYRSTEEWRHLRATDPAAFLDACELDEYIRDKTNDDKTRVYLHRYGLPLREAIDIADPPQSQQSLFGWQDECDGICGL